MRDVQNGGSLLNPPLAAVARGSPCAWPPDCPGADRAAFATLHAATLTGHADLVGLDLIEGALLAFPGSAGPLPEPAVHDDASAPLDALAGYTRRAGDLTGRSASSQA